MTSIKASLEKLRNEIPGYVKLVAVSKVQPDENILEAYNAGQRCFGENKVQEIIRKQPQLPGDIEWHFIGHLQRNKVKFIAPFVTLIESVDSQRLLMEVNNQGTKIDRVIPCLLQFHIADEESKFGFSLEEATSLLDDPVFESLDHIQITGVMGMATFTDDMDQVRGEFRRLKKYFDALKSGFFSDDPDFREISMGMTGDYQVAIEEGSTIVRIGTAVFGARNYSN